jgi:hypothetical protein
MPHVSICVMLGGFVIAIVEVNIKYDFQRRLVCGVMKGSQCRVGGRIHDGLERWRLLRQRSWRR